MEFEITPGDLQQLRANGEAVRIIDVREPAEWGQARLQTTGAAQVELMPMRTVPAHLAEIEEEERPIVVICHHGVRSLEVVDWLRAHGVENCRSLAGGIDRWSLEADRSVPRY